MRRLQLDPAAAWDLMTRAREDPGEGAIKQAVEQAMAELDEHEVTDVVYFLPERSHDAVGEVFPQLRSEGCVSRVFQGVRAGPLWVRAGV